MRSFCVSKGRRATRARMLSSCMCTAVRRCAGRSIAALASLEGLRPAEAGEFTRRALLNGKLDLAQVEGVADLLAAETAAQVRQAMALLDGALSGKAARWRSWLVRALALLEASIDFGDEDLPPSLIEEVDALLAVVEADFVQEISGSAASERLREGFEVALVGAPNVGKSTLLNYLSGRDAALTSEVAGTTRDVIEVRMDLSGLPVTLIDMAGLRTTTDPLEEMGVDRARRRATRADMRIFLLEDERDIFGLGVLSQRGDQIVLNKADTRAEACRAVSGVTGAGVAKLLEGIVAELSGRVPSARHDQSRSPACGRGTRAERRARGARGSCRCARWRLKLPPLSFRRRCERLTRWSGELMWRRCWTPCSGASASASRERFT